VRRPFGTEDNVGCEGNPSRAGDIRAQQKSRERLGRRLVEGEKLDAQVDWAIENPQDKLHRAHCLWGRNDTPRNGPLGKSGETAALGASSQKRGDHRIVRRPFNFEGRQSLQNRAD
jgi:hypothetical protein